MKNARCRGRSLISKDGRKIINCRRCGYIHVHPMYSGAELEKFYADQYSESTPSHIWFEKLYNITRMKKRGAILDIGCWEGDQLGFFKKAGWQCTGTELNKRAASIASGKGIKVYQIPIRELFDKFADRKWDVINAAYILEHIPDPAGFLKLLKRHLKKDGIAMIEVPNEFSPFQKAYLKREKAKPYWVVLPDHLNYFDKDGLERLVKRAGYRIVHAEGSFPMEMFLLMGDDYKKIPQLGKNCFRKVVLMEEALRVYDPGLLSSMYEALYQKGIGRSTVLYLKVR